MSTRMRLSVLRMMREPSSSATFSNPPTVVEYRSPRKNPPVMATPMATIKIRLAAIASHVLFDSVDSFDSFDRSDGFDGFDGFDDFDDFGDFAGFGAASGCDGLGVRFDSTSTYAGVELLSG